MLTKADLYHEAVSGEILICPACKYEYSADVHDYFYWSDDHVLKCVCGTQLELERREAIQDQ